MYAYSSSNLLVLNDALAVTQPVILPNDVTLRRCQVGLLLHPRTGILHEIMEISWRHRDVVTIWHLEAWTWALLIDTTVGRQFYGKINRATKALRRHSWHDWCPLPRRMSSATLMASFDRRTPTAVIGELEYVWSQSSAFAAAAAAAAGCAVRNHSRATLQQLL